MRDANREAQWAKRQQRAGEWLDSLLEGRGAGGLKECQVTEVRFKLPHGDQVETLMIVKACNGQEKWIGFCGGLDPVTALLVWRAKDAKGGLKWREDVPYGQR